MQRALIVLAAASAAGLAAAAGDEKADTVEVAGVLIVPADVASIEKSVIDIRLYRFDPLLADVSATLLDEVQIEGFVHEKGKETKRPFVVGRKTPPVKVDPRMSYYVTLFVHGGDPASTPRTHMGTAADRKGLCSVLTGGHPREITMAVRPVGGGRRPTPGPLVPPGRAKAGGGNSLQTAEHVFVAKLKTAKPGPVARSLPPIYTHRLVMVVEEVLRGDRKPGAEITGSHSARQMEQPTFPVGETCIVAADSVPGQLRVASVRKATREALREAHLIVLLPMGWSAKGDEVASPWAALGEGAWPRDARIGSNLPRCVKTRRPALRAGKGVRFTAEPVPPPKEIKWTNPDGDGEYKITVTNTTDQPREVPALLSAGGKVLWAESLVILCQDKARPAPGAKPVTGEPEPTKLAPGESVSRVVNAMLLQDVNWPRGGYRIEFRFCLGELSATESFYYLLGHHDKVRKAAVKAAGSGS